MQVPWRCNVSNDEKALPSFGVLGGQSPGLRTLVRLTRRPSHRMPRKPTLTWCGYAQRSANALRVPAFGPEVTPLRHSCSATEFETPLRLSVLPGGATRRRGWLNSPHPRAPRTVSKPSGRKEAPRAQAYAAIPARDAFLGVRGHGRPDVTLRQQRDFAPTAQFCASSAQRILTLSRRGSHVSHSQSEPPRRPCLMTKTALPSPDKMEAPK